MTPFPPILFVWGIAMWFGLLPNRILIWRLPPMHQVVYARRVLGLVGIVSGGLWLALHIWWPAHMTDRAGWAMVTSGAILGGRLIAQSFAEHRAI